jgi:cell division protein FtsB
MTELSQQIMNITDEIKYKYGNDYAEQVNEAMNDVHNNLNVKTTHVLVDFVELVINNDYSQPQINALKKDVKELKEENKILKEEIKVLKQDNVVLKNNNDKLTKQVNKLMRNHYNLVLWQAYKNVEYYIIQKITGFDKDRMEKINTNLTEFMNNSDNNKYVNDINKFITKFNINNYSSCLGRLSRNRITEAHPNPIELDDLEDACEDMKNVYTGIEELYKNYKEVYDYFIKMKL